MSEKLELETIFSKTSGHGEALLVLHGWGMNSSAWQAVADRLEQHFEVTWVDLPGHGKSRQVQADSLSDIVAYILPLIHQSTHTHIMGWSLGGLIAQEIIRQHPDLINKAVFVASTPCFAQQDAPLHWLHAMSQEVLEAFSANLQSDVQGTIKRFIALQFMGVKHSQAIQKALREGILRDLPDTSALNLGLNILQHEDFRDLKMSHEQLWLLGEKDRLIPVEVKDELQVLHPTSIIEVLTSAGHAPFMTHPEQFADMVIRFLSTE